MRFMILQPPTGTTIDPRMQKHSALADLHALAAPVAEFSTEEDCAKQVRLMYPDAVAIPMEINLGAGKLVIMGMIDDEQARQRLDADAVLPFVLLVHPLTDNDSERMRLKKGDRPFQEETWKLRPVCPGVYKSTPVEVRSSDARIPVFASARIGTHRDHLVVFIEAHGVEFSIVFDDKNVVIRDRSDLDATGGGHGELYGGIFSPPVR